MIADKENAIKMIDMFHEMYPTQYPLVYAIKLQEKQLLIGHIT